LPVAIIGFPIPEPNTILRNDRAIEAIICILWAHEELCRKVVDIRPSFSATAMPGVATLNATPD